MSEIVLRLTLEQVQVVLTGLGELPLRVSNDTYVAVIVQAKRQQQQASELQQHPEAETDGGAGAEGQRQ